MGKTTGATDSLFIVPEVTRGTFVMPAATDVWRLIGDADLAQARVTAESLERVNSYSLTDLLQLRYTAGSFSFQGYLKRTGTKDTTVPSIHTLLTNAMGRQTPHAGVDTTYELYRTTDPLLNFSIAHRKGGMCFYCSGAFVKDLTIPFQATAEEAAIGRLTATGEFYKMLWAGEAEISAQCATPWTEVTVDPDDLAPYDGTANAAVRVAGKFCIGSRVELVGATGGSATGSVITDIDPTTGIITVDAPLATSGSYAVGTVLRGFMPTETETGVEIAGHKGLMKYDSLDFTPLLSGTIHLTVPRRTLVEEKNNNEFATDDAMEGKRKVTVEGVRAYFDPRGTVKQDLFYALQDVMTRKAITIDMGNTAGLIYQFSMPNCITMNPKLSGSGIVEMEMVQAALATAALDDEFTIISK